MNEGNDKVNSADNRREEISLIIKAMLGLGTADNVSVYRQIVPCIKFHDFFRNDDSLIEELDKLLGVGPHQLQSILEEARERYSYAEERHLASGASVTKTGDLIGVRSSKFDHFEVRVDGVAPGEGALSMSIKVDPSTVIGGLTALLS